MSDTDDFKALVHGFNQQYSRSVWDLSRIDSTFSSRTYGEVEDARDIHFLCCIERHLVVAYQSGAYDPTLILLRICRTHEQPKIGAALEVMLDGQKHRFVSGNSGDILVPGEYTVRGSYTHVIRAQPTNDPSANWYNHFGIASPQELEERLPGIELEQWVRTIHRRNTCLHLALTNMKRMINKGKRKYF